MRTKELSVKGLRGMEGKNNCQDLNDFRVAMFGMIIMILGMGIGRFFYTPVLPVMLDEGLFTFSQLSYIASANYGGYLVGSIFFSFCRVGNISSPSYMLSGAAIGTSALIFSMAFTINFYLVLFIRFAAGIASAAMMIFSSITVMQRSHKVWVIASLYAGVGVGILLGNESVIIGLSQSLNAKNIWFGAGLISVVLLLLLFVLFPRRVEASQFASNESLAPRNIVWWELALIYGLAGFGYIIVATYLPMMAKTFNFQLLANHLWSFVGIAIVPSCFIWLWGAHRWGVLRCLMLNLLIQGGCVLLTLFSHSLFLIVLSCIGFGFTFMGTTSLVMPLAKRLHAPYGINLLGLATLTYGFGQILGPLLTSFLQFGSHTIALSVICGAVALFAAAGICQYCLCKKVVGVS
ncbi:YbfB/YjiJ family MFS transporter [Bartonella machadoae]|uniref:YbfB/YjiJ family MFS transporter n=1 Tax=Bartonella machadoae TaxID=2893471 RepID=UPI001F4CC6A0|nr:YbfB/YjiJ family MFS transporter [Bartonella machadoae]UNE55383.1 YbfB/YjiJ family MFS transporter [Bartonella machadoae]